MADRHGVGVEMIAEQRVFWEHAGRAGYRTAYCSSNPAGAAIRKRLFDVAINLADQIGIPRNGRVLDVGCGDGEFSNDVLAGRYRNVVGIDFSRTGIERATRMRPSENVHFQVADLARDEFPNLGQFDGAFLVGILHHIKRESGRLLKQLSGIAPLIIVLEPNGAHLVRKLLELTPSYVAAGEDSFTHGQLKRLFASTGFAIRTHLRFNIFPNFTPPWAYRIAKPIEPLIEATPILRGLCTLNAYGCSIIRRDIFVRY